MTTDQENLFSMFTDYASKVVNTLEAPANCDQCWQLSSYASKQDKAHISALMNNSIHLTFDKAERMLNAYFDCARDNRSASSSVLVML